MRAKHQFTPEEIEYIKSYNELITVKARRLKVKDYVVRHFVNKNNIHKKRTYKLTPSNNVIQGYFNIDKYKAI